MIRTMDEYTAGTPDGADPTPPPCFPEWALREMDRLLQERSRARTAEERSQAELQAAMLRDAADRYGRHLAECSEF